MTISNIQPTKHQKNNSSSIIKSFNKMMQVLDCFDRESTVLTLNEIAKCSGLPKATAQRVASSLRHIGFLEQDGPRNSYRLGLKLYMLGSTVLASFDFHGRARVHAERLQLITGEKVHLCMFDGSQMVFVEILGMDSTSNAQITRIETSPVHCTGVGKAFLAFQDENLIQRIINEGLKAHTPQTITNPDDFRAEMRTIRKNGYAIDDREHTENMICVAAPIRNSAGQAIGAISVSTSPERMPQSRCIGISDVVIDVAKEISRTLGCRENSL